MFKKKILDNYHMCEHHTVMECWPRSHRRHAGILSLSKQFVLFSKLFSVEQNKTPHQARRVLVSDPCSLPHSLCKFPIFIVNYYSYLRITTYNYTMGLRL